MVWQVTAGTILKLGQKLGRRPFKDGKIARITIEMSSISCQVADDRTRKEDQWEFVLLS